MGYQWDSKKAEANLKNHGVDFADATGVFKDDYALSLREEFIDGEQRFVSIGLDFLARIIVVVYTYRGDDIRIISARLATKRERKAYEDKRI
ncbi:BrnT family toxin [bacterium]|nr:MAG: BrnT family toxin [candidate division KSB1 bacterium]MBC6947686.1 BrnT family toxin [candidate division KSB1 bacterium]MCE7945315.1 BrnT family toxin [Chlorobi bacterium CHB1]MCL4709226.1 BrnT family toxin [bacterium]RIK75980.1 MAG: hypothetical protein DCC62_12230 [candidate division KSB1 bacterium]